MIGSAWRDVRRVPARCPFGFTIVEALVTIAIIGLLVGIATPYLWAARLRARDQARITDLNTLYRFLGAATGVSLADEWPAGVPAEGDLSLLTQALALKYGSNLFAVAPRDPSARVTESRYRYRYEAGKLVIYANLEDRSVAPTLPYGEPTPGGGRGTFVGAATWVNGVNGTNRYYQVSN